MIEPRWLEGAFIVHNDAINYDDSPAEEPRRKVVSTNIHVSRYRDFVGQNPDKVTYFQPILDTLQYAPSKLELGRDTILVEGKNDFYALTYFARNFGIKCRFMPGTGAGGLAPLISLYLGWGANFFVLLDDDGAGQQAKKRYQEDYLLSDARIGTLRDLIPSLAKGSLERLLSDEGKGVIEKKIGHAPTKKDVGRLFQELLATGATLDFDHKTTENFRTLLIECTKYLKALEAPNS